METDIKVMDSLRERDETEAYLINSYNHSPLLFFAEAVARTRKEPGVSIEDIAKCFNHQFDDTELSALRIALAK
jgi:hypothetical protein